MQVYRIPEDIRSDIRSFAFWFGNNTLIPHGADFDFDYEPCVFQDRRVIGTVFSVYLNTLRAHYDNKTSNDSAERAAQWLFKYCNSDYHIEVPFEPWELVGFEADDDFFDTIKLFAFQISQGLVEEDDLKSIDYLSHFFEAGSFMEGIFAVFTNVLQIDERGRAINIDQARRRASQFLRKYLDDTYQVLPEFEEWETELV